MEYETEGAAEIVDSAEEPRLGSVFPIPFMEEVVELAAVPRNECDALDRYL